MRAVVCGYIGTFPVGGVVWDYGHYVLALEALGYEVFYLEDSGQPVSSPTGDVAEAVRFLDRSLRQLSPAMGDRWHLRDTEDRTYGMSRPALLDAVATADVFLNVSGAGLLRQEYLDTACAVYVDTDPGWNHFDRFPAVDAWAADHPASGLGTYRDHAQHFTYATNLGRPGCDLPDMGLNWHPTRPPVSTRFWSSRPPGRTWTTVMNWDNYERALQRGPRTYGAKEREFVRIENLPSRLDVPLEVAVDPQRAPVERWRQQGWRHVSAATVSRDAGSYRDYLASSRGELSVAKNVYVDTCSGWFSCRSTCYLASGRPVVVQDTGFGRDVPVGEGLLAFSDLDSAQAALETVEADYPHHAEAARSLAEDYFEGAQVLAELLNAAGVAG